MITRREALRLTATAVGGLSVAGRNTLAQDPQTGMGIGSSSYALRFRADRGATGKASFADALGFLEYCHSLGAGGVQVDLKSFPSDKAGKLGRLARKYGMYVEVSAPLPRDTADLPRFQQAIRTAKNAGASVIRTVLLTGRRYETFDSADDFERFAVQSWKSLTMAEPILRKRRMKLAVENHKDWRIDELLGLMRRLQSEFVGICVDTGNNIALLEDPMDVAEQFAPYAFAVHLKDMAVQKYDGGFLLAEVPFGEGIVDLPRIVQVLRQGQPRVRFSLEMITRDPLQIPCFTERYWPTFDRLPGRDLARTWGMVRAKQRDQPLPRVSHLSQQEQLRLEDDNVRKCLAYARDRLQL